MFFFAVFADTCVMFQCMLIGFAEIRLRECRMFSFKNACTSQKSRVFPFTFHLFLLLEALQGFGRYWKALQALHALRGFARLWAASRGFGRLWEC